MKFRAAQLAYDAAEPDDYACSQRKGDPYWDDYPPEPFVDDEMDEK